MSTLFRRCRLLGSSFGNVWGSGSAIARQCSSWPKEDIEQAVEKESTAVNEMFVEAREEIEFTKEDIGTTYFNDAFQDAKKLVDETISEYKKLLNSLNEDEKGRLQRSMGMKMEQLKAELEHLNEH